MSPPVATDVTNDPQAHALLREAHAKAYRFPQGFAGFTADITVTGDAGSYTGTVEVSGPRDIAVSLDAPEDLTAWAKQQMASMAGHRWPTAYEDGDGRWTMTLDAAPSALGQLVTQHDDPFTSSYRVRDGHISQVNRQMGSTRFTITMQSHVPASDGRLLPETFTVTYWDMDAGQLSRTEIFSDTYGLVDGVDVPLERRIVSADDAGMSGRAFVLGKLRLKAS